MSSSLVHWVSGHGLQIVASLGVWATLVLAAAWLVARSLRRSSSAVRYCVWQLGLTGLLFVPVLSALVPGIPLGFSLASDSQIAAPDEPPVALLAASPSVVANPVAVANPVVAASPGPSPAPGRAPDRVEEPFHLLPPAPEPAAVTVEPAVATVGRSPKPIPGEIGPGEITAVEIAPAGAAKSSLRWSLVLLSIWGLGVVANLLWLAAAALRLRSLVRGAQPLCDPRFELVERELQPRRQRARDISLMTSPEMRVPAVIGFLRPRILLPAGCTDWSADRIRIVLSHELAHVERHDIFWQLVARVAASLYWFHPLVWLALERMREERERSCDDRVLLAGVPPIDYAEGLVDVAAALVGSDNLGFGGIGMASRSQLEDRLRSILDHSSCRNPASAAARRRLMAGTAVVVLVLGLLRPFSPLAVAAIDPNNTDPNTTGPTTTEPKTTEQTTAPPPATETKTEAKAETTTTSPRKASHPGDVTTSGTMRISIVDLEGQPLPGATVHVCVGTASTCDGPPTKDFVAGSDGQADVEIPKTVGYLAMWAGSKGFGSIGAEWRPFMNGEPIPETYTFRLPKGTTIGGFVRDEQDQPIAGARVRVADTNVFIARDDAPTTDASGRWTLEDVAPGENWISFSLSHPDFVSDVRWSDTQRKQNITSAAVRAQTAVAVMQRGASLTGTLTDPDGKPVPGAVVVWGDAPWMSRGFQQEVRTDEAGRYRFPPLPNGRMPVAVMAPGWMPELRVVEVAPAVPPVDFRLKPGKKLRLRFVDSSDTPISDVAVAIGPWRRNRSVYNNQHPDLLDTAIPSRTKDGIYEWTWAPDDPVTYTVSAAGIEARAFVKQDITLTADDQQHVQILQRRLHVTGKVTDARTGQPIQHFAAIPVRGGHLYRNLATDFSDGHYALDLEPFPGYEQHVWIEADGYRRVMGEGFRAEHPILNCDFALEPAPPATGRIVDEAGSPVAGARVFLATRLQGVTMPRCEKDPVDGDATVSDADGSFAFAAQFEPYTVVAMDDRGYAEASRKPEQSPGELALAPWARVEGRLFDAGKPVARSVIQLQSLRPRLEDDAHIFEKLIQKTDDTGRFVFSRVAPRQYALIDMLDEWNDDLPVGTSESVPLDVKPGEHVTRDLGHDGPLVRGRVARKGETADDFDLSHSRNWLAPRARDNESLESDEWPALRVPRRKFRHHYFVKLASDGTFLISGVPPGEYDLVLKVEPQGCGLQMPGVTTEVSTQIVPIRVAESDVADGLLDLGTVELSAPAGPKLDELVPDFDFATLDESPTKLSELRGQYVLLHFWSSLCNAWAASLPAVAQIHDQHAASGRLVILGVPLEPFPGNERARQFIRNHPQRWMYGFLSDKVAIANQFGVDRVPVYFLIDPAGKLISKHYTVDGAKKKIATLIDLNGPPARK